MKRLVVSSMALLLACGLLGCARPLTVYTDASRGAVMRLVAPFTRETGIPVDVIRFADARDLADAIAAYKDGAFHIVNHDDSYAYANVAFSQDIALGEALRTRDALERYEPEIAAGIPEGAKADGLWYGMGGYGWVLAWNTGLVKNDPPARLMDLASGAWPAGAVAMPNPNYTLFYTAGASAALGGNSMEDFLRNMIARDAQWMASPEETAGLVAEGKAWACLTTLKEAEAQRQAGAPVAWAVPDQEAGGIGAYAQYNTVCLCKVSSMPEQAKLLVDYLLDPETEALSVKLGLSDVTLRPCSSQAPVVVPLKADLAAAQGEMQNGLGNVLTYFTNINPEYKGK